MTTPVYRPKIKVDTVKGLAQKMAATTAGKAVSSTAFKKFLRSDKDLKSITYREGSSHITKGQAQHFLGKVAQKIAGSEKMKLSMFSREMGIKGVSHSGTVSAVGVRNAYQQAARQEVTAEASKGPDRQEAERQQRILTGRKLLQQRERADEMRKQSREQVLGRKFDASPKSARPPQMTPVSGLAGGPRGDTRPPTGSGPGTPVTDTGRGAPSFTPSDRRGNTLVFPVRNLSQMRELSMLATKLEETVRRSLVTAPGIVPFPRVATMKALQKMGWAEGRAITPEFSKKIARELQMDFVFYGTVAHERAQAHVRIFVLSVKTNAILMIAEVWEDPYKTFEIEEKVSWQIHNFFNRIRRADAIKPEVKIPSPSEAIDMQI